MAVLYKGTDKIDDDRLMLRTLHAPGQGTGGLSFSHWWNRDGKVFQGFVLDVTVDGPDKEFYVCVLQVLLRGCLEEGLRLSEAMRRVNRQAQEFLTPGFFATAVCFAADMTKGKIHIVTAGQNRVLAASSSVHGWMRLSGPPLGVEKAPVFVERILPMQPGDIFYFMTEGVLDSIKGQTFEAAHDMNRTMGKFRTLLAGRKTPVEAVALCLEIRGARRWPLRFEFSTQEELSSLRPRFRDVIAREAGRAGPLIEVVVNEAVNNAMRSAAKQADPRILVKLNRFGSRLLVRVKDSGNGFDPDHVLREALSAEARVTEEIMGLPESGRGLALISRISDCYHYNQQGNELMMVSSLKG